MAAESESESEGADPIEKAKNDFWKIVDEEIIIMAQVEVIANSRAQRVE